MSVVGTISSIVPSVSSYRNHKKRRKPSPVSAGVIHIARRGYGFVDTPEGEYFVLRGYLRGAMDGDLVEVVRLRSLEARRRQQMRKPSTQNPRPGGGVGDREMLGGVRRVIERAHTTVVGTLRLENGLGVVIPQDERIQHDIFIDLRTPGKQADEGAIVVVRITTYPSKLECASGYIEEVVGHETDQGMDIEVIIRKHGLETVFSAAALEEAEAVCQSAGTPEGAEAFGASGVPGVPGTPRAYEAQLIRRDLRERFVFTIDPADARDFDDALSVDYLDGKMRLGVHIADVSAYVPWNSALDLDARRRATSVYLPDRVIPMLPPALSDDLCSLKPHEDRLAFTVDMLMRNDGSVESAEFYPSIIHSSVRLSYDEVQELLGAKTSAAAAAAPAALIGALNKLTKKLARRREQRGAIDFEGTEAKVVLDESGHPVAVNLRTKTEATSLVEESMILANEQIAAFMLAAAAPMVYRIHDEPYPAALIDLLPTLQEFGYAMQRAPQTSLDIQAIIRQSKGKPEHTLISTLLLRSMKRARYAPVFTTHYGLASEAYTHFTSPIRRYPDLMVHRLLRYLLAGEQPPEDMLKQLEWISAHASEMEREAEHASFEATALKLREYLAPLVGERFSGIISGINSYGFYVRENTTTAEGFVACESLPEGFAYDPARYRYHHADFRQSYRLGQPVSVLLKAVDLSRGSLVFEVMAATSL
ncbi:MAG: VacB/RNase II family 3'-5' exoribonuclease [Coriobacteriales bacterium]|nr:VacB/RNase II family 3'-5' exoribonuclease [Coriobacteriales bacterium]